VNCDSGPANERYVGEQYANHPLSFLVRGLWILPEPWKVTC
jgi:hypothetical protein